MSLSYNIKVKNNIFFKRLSFWVTLNFRLKGFAEHCFLSRVVLWTEVKPLTLLSIYTSQHITVTRASREGSEAPGCGGHVSDRTASPGTIAEEELLQWWPSLLHGDPAKCDRHLQKSNPGPRFRRHAGVQTLWTLSWSPQVINPFFLR